MHALGYNFLSEYVLFRLKQNFGNFDSYCSFDEMLIDWVWLSQTGKNLALDPCVMTLSQIIPFWSSYQSIIT